MFEIGDNVVIVFYSPSFNGKCGKIVNKTESLYSVRMNSGIVLVLFDIEMEKVE